MILNGGMCCVSRLRSRFILYAGLDDWSNMGPPNLWDMVVLGSTLTLTLVLCLIYVAYLMLRAEVKTPGVRDLQRLGIVGFVDVPLSAGLLKVRTLHPKPVVIQEGALLVCLQP